jgi:hypothetical protein
VEETRTGERVDSRPSNSRHVVLALATFVLSTLVFLIVLIEYAASRDPREPSSKQWLHPLVVYTPFTLHRGDAFEGATEGLHLPIYPGSIPMETGTLDLEPDTSAASPGPTLGVVLLRLQVSAPLPTVAAWYKENFPKPYSELLDQRILSGPAQENWFQVLDAQIDSQTILYQTDDSMARRGVLLQTSNDGGTVIRVYYFSRGR